MNNEYYTDQNGSIRRIMPKVRQSKKERIRERWEGKEDTRFNKTGRGHRSDDHEKVKDYLRKIHPETARKVQISQATGIKQDRVLIILNNLSGLQDTYTTDSVNKSDVPFLVYEEQNKITGYTQYGIYKCTETGIFQ